MKTFKLIITLLVTIFIVSLILANPWMVDQKFPIVYMGYTTAPIHLVILFLITITLGATLAALSMLSNHIKLKYTIREQRKKINQMEEELSSLRNLPLRENVHLVPNNEISEIPL